MEDFTQKPPPDAPLSARSAPIGMQLYELINLSIGAALFGISLIGLVVALVKRSFPPIKAKSPHLVALALLANIAFWIGKLHAHGFLGYEGILHNCTIWGIWLQCVFGVCTMNAVLSLRYQRLYTVLILRQSAWSLRTYIPSLLYAFVVLVCAILSSAVPEKMGFYWDADANNCYSTPVSIYLFLPCVVIGVIALAGLTWRLRRVRDAFNEYRETRYGVILLFIACLINAILMATEYGRTRWAKHILVVISFLWGNIYFWMVMGKPIFGYLFDKKGCQERFVAGLEIETCQYVEFTRNKSDSKTKMVSQSRYFDTDTRKTSRARSNSPIMKVTEAANTRKMAKLAMHEQNEEADQYVSNLNEQGTRLPSPVVHPANQQYVIRNSSSDDAKYSSEYEVQSQYSAHSQENWQALQTRTRTSSNQSQMRPTANSSEVDYTNTHRPSNTDVQVPALFPSQHERWEATPYMD